MARAIDQFLAAIRQAIYGRDVREAIASGIEQCYEDSTASAQKADIEAKGAEVLASIPDTYEDLQNDVDNVKSALAQTINLLNDDNVIGIEWAQGYWSASGILASSDQSAISSNKMLAVATGVNIHAASTGAVCKIAEFKKNSNNSFTRLRYIGSANNMYDVTLENTVEGCMYVVTMYRQAGITPSEGANCVVTVETAISQVYSDVAQLKSEMPDVKNSVEKLDGYFDTGSISLASLTDMTVGYSYLWNGSNPIGHNVSAYLTENQNSVYLNPILDISQYKNKKVTFRVNQYGGTSIRMFGFCSSSGTISTVFVEKEADWVYRNGAYEFTTTITDDYLFFSISNMYGTTLTSLGISVKTKDSEFENDVKEISEETAQKLIEEEEKAVWVSPSGNDSNSGEYSSPLATVSKALQLSNNVFVMGGKYEQTIDLSAIDHGDVYILSYEKQGLPVFYAPGYILSTLTSPVSGYSKVKSFPCTKSFNENNIWIWQDGVSDPSTLIADSERMPQERGYEYRCSDTMISKCAATVLSDALTEIESAEDYKWFADGTNLYLSCPATVTSTNPIAYSTGETFIRNATRKHRLHIAGIKTKYMVFNISETTGSTIEDCAAVNVFGAGAFIYNRVLGGKFIRCEAARCVTGVNGDGFNGHSDNSGEPHSKQTTIRLIDCWSHDNNDDGYSDHERSETEIVGGLYEYNGKGGVTPSYGSHCVCHNVVSRNNKNGFYYTGKTADAEGGKYGQMLCIDCIAINNKKSGSYGAGFVVDMAGNSAYLAHCISLNNKFGYYAGQNCLLTIVGCETSDDTYTKDGDGQITVVQTSAVE